MQNFILNNNADFRIVVYPNILNKFSLYLTGKITAGVEIIGFGPMSMRAYWSLLKYVGLVGSAIEKNYHVFIREDGSILKEGSWYLEFRKQITQNPFSF